MNRQCYSKQEQNMITISSLSSNFCYWLIYPFTIQDSLNSKKIQYQVPDLLIFEENDALTVEVLVKKYNQQYRKKAQTFQICEGNTYLQLKDTIKNVKKKLRKDKIKGIEFFLFQEEEMYMDECCVTQIIHNQKPSRKLHFQIKPINYSVYLDVNDFDKIDDVKYKLSLQIKRIWSKQVQSQMIDFANQNDIQNFIQKQATIQVFIKGFNLNLHKENKKFLIIKKSGQLKFNTRNFQLAAIEGKKLVDLLKMLDPDQDWKQYGLKIGDIIVKSKQIISQKCKTLFQKSQINIIHFVGIVVNEYQIFLSEKSKIDISQFDFESILVKNERNVSYRINCEKAIRDRADKVNYEYFKGNIQNIRPVFYYTSQLKFKSSDGKNEAPLYRVVNSFLRNQNFAETTQEEYTNKWEYIYQCLLLNKLQKLPPLKPIKADHQLKQGWTNRALWRVVNYMSEYNVGQLILFKQFISVFGGEQSLAQQFGGQFMFKITKSKSGRSITEFSQYRNDDQILFPSYTKFVVTKINKQYLNKKKNKKIVCYQIEEVEDPPLPPNQVNFILWVDDRTAQGKEMWADFNNFQHTTVMHQLVSTEELRKWLTINKAVYSNQKQIVSVAMISNMTRKQKDNKVNGFAGVDAIKVFRQFLPDGNVFLFIGDYNLALEQLKKFGLTTSQKLRVSNEPKQLKNFLKSNIRIY